MRISLWQLLLCSLLLSACSITPLDPIPRPLPEALDWAQAADLGSGSFLGLKTRENLGGGFDDLEFRSGTKVVRVVENSPAAQAGMRVGDILLKFNGVEIDDPETLEALVDKAQAGAEAQLEVQREDTVFVITLKLGAPMGVATAKTKASYRMDPSRSRAAWLTGRGGVVLVGSHKEAPFRRAGIQVGSVVTALDGLPMHSDRALIRNLQARAAGSSVAVGYMDSEGKQHSAKVHLQSQPTRLTELSLPVISTYRASADGEEASWVVLDLWFISLFRYSREGNERNLSILRFVNFQTGIGELSE